MMSFALCKCACPNANGLVNLTKTKKQNESLFGITLVGFRVPKASNVTETRNTTVSSKPRLASYCRTIELFHIRRNRTPMIPIGKKKKKKNLAHPGRSQERPRDSTDQRSRESRLFSILLRGCFPILLY